MELDTHIDNTSVEVEKTEDTTLTTKSKSSKAGKTSVDYILKKRIKINDLLLAWKKKKEKAEKKVKKYRTTKRQYTRELRALTK